MKKPAPTLYLFNNIFYPQTVIPLTVTDATSKDMLLKCYENNILIALYHPHLRSKKVGTLGKILMVENHTDGSMSFVVQGLTRIKLLNIEIQIPYPHYQIKDYFDLDEKSQIFVDAPLERLHRIFEHWLNRHINSTKERERFIKDMTTPSKLIDNLCMFMIKDIELKQIFLESTSLQDRIRMMNALLIGEAPETEDIEICEAIKNFERLDNFDYENAS